MRQPSPVSLPVNTKPQSAGWDIGVAAFALACMTAGFWRLWPGAYMLEAAPLGPLIFKAGLAALGFVAIATRWEATLRAFSTNPTSLVLLILACVSPLWAITPADALRNAILLVVIWGFGVALTLRFKPRELAEICGFAGVFGLLAQFIAHRGSPAIGAYDGDLAFAVLACAWAAWQVPARRLIWLLALGCSAALAAVTNDLAALGGAVGLIIGVGLAKAGAAARRGGAVSLIVTAWVIVACIIGVTTFALFAAQPVTARISEFLFALGNQAVLGQGFGNAGHSVLGAVGAGLGIVGACTVVLVVFATLFQALLGRSEAKSASEAFTAVWFATLGAICVSPAEVSIFGPIWILFGASTFGIALANVAPIVRRVPLMARNSQQSMAPVVQSGVRSKPVTAPRSQAQSSSRFGLRPKI